VSWRERGALAAAALAVDRVIGDPRDRWHPVAWFGRAMASREARRWRDDRRSGVSHLAAGFGLATAPTLLASAAARRLGGAAAERAVLVLVVATALGARSLDRRAAEIGRALEQGGIDEARRALPALVGRDPAGLDEGEIARAVVESVAENTVDAVVAPLMFALAGGAVGAAAYRAVNTLDAMVGHRNERYRRFGWAAARADDLANLLPARLAAAAVLVGAPRQAAEIVRAVLLQAPRHPSPNAGVVEAAFAGALGLRLGGVNRYGGVAEHRAELGVGRPPTAADISRARRLSRRVTTTLAALLAVPYLLERLGREEPAAGRAGG